jgi:aryl-alcohol dehydrogenase-like predicted oxidoreductase
LKKRSVTRHSRALARSLARRRSLIAAHALPFRQKQKQQKLGIKIAPMGIGAWSWGDRSNYWGYGASYGKEDNKAAFDALQSLAKEGGKMGGGSMFIDTAEVYGYGLSERFVGEFIQNDTSGAPKPFVCTKFAPLPWRVARSQVVSAAKASAERLQTKQIDLYIQHWPGFFTSAFSNDAFLEGLADVADSGLARAVGASNFNADRVRRGADLLERRGHCLSSNQVQYSLLYRAPETNGVLEACKERGVTLVAYSPLCQGLLSGKYKPGAPLPTGPRAAIYRSKINEIGRLIDVMRIVGESHGGKTPSQVALNWLMCKGVVPIPGAKNAEQLRDLAGACDWRLTDAEWDELDKESRKVKPPLGAPFENW